MINKKIILGLMVLGLLNVIGGTIYLFENKKAAQNAEEASRALIYSNQEYGFEISYQSNLIATTTFQRYYALGDSWRADALLDDNGGSKGRSIVSIPVYRIDNHTDGAYVSYPLYYDAELRIGVSSDPKDIQECLLSTNEILPASEDAVEVINGIVFYKFIIQNAGMSQYVGGVSYRTVHNNTCFAVEQLKTGSSYRDMPNPKDIPDSILNSYYDQIPDIIKTFKFIQSDVSMCSCRDGYVKDGNSCTPKCYYSTPKCLMPSYLCTSNP